MTLTDEDRALLRLAAQTGLQRFGRKWRGGRSDFPHSQVRRLRKSGYLVIEGDRARVTAQARRALREDKAPPVGVEIIARGRRATLRGRVIASGPNTATLLPLDSGKAERYVGQEVVHYPGVYEVSRPHPGAPWKGEARPLGYYLDKPFWPALASIVPPIWNAPFESEPFTIARLREAKAKRDAIGGSAMTVEEHAADMCFGTYYPPFTDVRRRVEQGENGPDVCAYLAEVIRRDPVPFDAADFEYALQSVKRSIIPYHPDIWGSLRVCSLAEIAKDHRFIRPEMLQRAYACLVPWAREVVDKGEARRAAYEARRLAAKAQSD